MTKNTKENRLGPHASAYATAAALVASGALVGVIAYEVISSAKAAPDETFYALAGMSFVLIGMVAERLLKRTVYGVSLTTRWQDRLTFAIPTGFVFSILMLQGTSGVWAVTSQLIGGWVIFGCVAVLLDAAWAWVKSFFSREKPARVL